MPIYHEIFKIQNTKGRNSGRVGGLGIGAADRWPGQQITDGFDSKLVDAQQ